MGRLFDYHTHSRFCDGKGELSEYVEAAVASGLVSIGLSGHAPCPVESDWHMKEPDLPRYLESARALARAQEGRVSVLVGLEADYIPGVISPRAVRQAHRLDYVIGGVHYLGRLSDGTPFTIDGTVEELQRGIREGFGGDARRAVARYFELVGEMAATEAPDVIAHFDLIKKNNKGLFDEGSLWYRAVATEALRALAASGCVAEINTGPVSRNYGTHFYPGDGILAPMAELRIPVTLGSDAHRPGHVAAHFGAALDALRRAGYRECWRRDGSSWSAVPLDTLG